MGIQIARRLNEGPDYAPDWRHRTVQAYLAEIAASKDSKAKLQEICWAESDPFVRQYLKFRFNGCCVAGAAFKYSSDCYFQNAATAAASMIRAMLVADRTPEEIAAEMGTLPINIVTFSKLFFDVRRYLGNEVFLQRIIFNDTNKDMAAESLRERRWLSAAFHRGWPGVEQVVFHRVAGTASEVEALTGKLHVTLASRALEYAMELEASGTAPAEADLQRFLALQNMQARQPAKEVDQQKSMTIFLKGIHAEVMQKVDEESDPKLKAIQGLSPNQDLTTPPVRRLRTRFASA